MIPRVKFHSRQSHFRVTESRSWLPEARMGRGVDGRGLGALSRKATLYVFTGVVTGACKIHQTARLFRLTLEQHRGWGNGPTHSWKSKSNL